ncbi:hypothetical protein BLNAU_6012 [Blattamonas nauphoetae]|uniref:Uncharacterized protein n=1 Tax=Blattamonas nauphoetae TaxID=2049346 RepID=A0ABQ9Y5H8_9EUKA|nr:hypothetical protein BLNAU_6012 [Blattamonas nauphoetae]
MSTSVTSMPHFPIPKTTQEQPSYVPLARLLCFTFNNLHVRFRLDLSSVMRTYTQLTQSQSLSTRLSSQDLPSTSLLVFIIHSPLAAITDGHPQHNWFDIAEVSTFIRPLCFLANTLHSFHPHRQFLFLTDAFDSAVFVLHAALFSSRSPSSCLPITASTLLQTTSSPPTSSEDPIEFQFITTYKRDTLCLHLDQTNTTLTSNISLLLHSSTHPSHHQRGNTTNARI